MIAGKIVNLRPIERGDLPAMVAWRNNPRVLRAFFTQSRLTMQDQEVWYEKYCSRQDEKLFVIETKERKAVGTIGLSKIDRINRSAELGRLMIGDDDEIGNGFALDAVRTVVGFAFSQLNLNRIWLEVFSWNLAAINVYIRCGFRQEGIKRQAVLVDGKFQDVILMSLLREDLLDQDERFRP